MAKPTTALTAEQIAQFHDELEEQQDDVLASGGSSSWKDLTHRLPQCFRCSTTPSEIVISAPEVEGATTTLTFNPCGHVFHATPDVLAAGLRLHNSRP